MSILLYILFAFPLPVLVGYPIARRQDKSVGRLLTSWVFGWLFLCATSFFPSLAFIFLKRSLTELTLFWAVIVLAQILWSIRCMIRDRETPFTGLGSRLRKTVLIEVIAVALILFHAWVTYHYMYVDNDDIVYVGAVTTSVDTNTLMLYDAVTGNLIEDFSLNDLGRLVTAPLFAFHAIIAKVTRIRPAPLCHTWLPPVLTMLFYASFALIGRMLFPDSRRKQGAFTAAVWLLAAFSYVSVYTSGTFLMIRSWQGKGQIVGLIVPMLFFIWMDIVKRGEMRWADMWIVLMTLTASCLMTTMGAMLAAILTGILCLLAALLLRDRKVILRTVPVMTVPAGVLVLYMII